MNSHRGKRPSLSSCHPPGTCFSQLLAPGFSTPFLVNDQTTLRHRQIWCLLTRYSTCCSTFARTNTHYQAFSHSVACLRVHQNVPYPPKRSLMFYGAGVPDKNLDFDPTQFPPQDNRTDGYGGWKPYIHRKDPPPPISPTKALEEEGLPFCCK